MRWNSNCPKCGFYYGNKTKKGELRCCKCSHIYPMPNVKKIKNEYR